MCIKSRLILHFIAIYIVVIFAQFSGQLLLCTKQRIPNNLHDNLNFSVRKFITRQFSHCPVNLISNSFFFVLRMWNYSGKIEALSIWCKILAWDRVIVCGLHTDVWWKYFIFLYFCLMPSSSISYSAVELCKTFCFI